MKSQVYILRADYCEDTTLTKLDSITEHPDVQKLIIQIVKLTAKNKDLKEILTLILNENFSGQSTLSPYAKRQAKQILDY